VKILLIEDDAPIASVVRRGLEGARFQVDVAEDGETGLRLALGGEYDLILLDLMLPGRDGWSICETLRRRRITTPILMLTARDAVDDRVRGLETGADDYLPKPFGPPELMARVRAVLRRARYAEAPTDEPVFRHGDLAIDFARHAVTRGGAPVTLTPTEYKLLVQLARHAGRVLVPEELLTAVWGPEYRDETQHVRLYVSRLRRKIEPDPEQPRYVLTKPGIGYWFASE
jgi:DNA-binding response OmpR family regulator